ncbi:restriction endonuclease subunit S [Thiovibrio sp. JS02]
MSWPRKTIGDVCEVVPGFAFKSKDLGDVGTPVIKIGNITENRSVDIESAQCLPEDLIENRHKKYFLRNGDILIAMTGATAGKVGRIRCAEDQALLLNQRVAKLCPISINPDFFWSAISTERYRTIFYGLGGGAAQPNMSGSQIEAVEIPYPPLAQQERIAFILSTYDDLIENNRRRIQLLEQAARLLYKEWFVHLRFPGHEHSQIIDGVPEGWEKKKLGDVADTNAESYRANNLPNEVNYIDISSVKQGRILSKNKMLSSEAPGRARRKGADGDIIWSNVRPNLRAYALVLEPDENDVFSTGFTILSPMIIPFSYLYLFVTTDEFVGHLVNHTTGASYPAVRPDDFERAEILLPAQSVLKFFHERIEPAFRMIQVLEKEINALAKARDLLLPKLINGEVAV